MVRNPPVDAGDAVQSLGWRIPWRRKWQPTPVFLPEKSHGGRSSVGYSSWDCLVTERTHIQYNETKTT